MWDWGVTTWHHAEKAAKRQVCHIWCHSVEINTLFTSNNGLKEKWRMSCYLINKQSASSEHLKKNIQYFFWPKYHCLMPKAKIMHVFVCLSVVSAKILQKCPEGFCWNSQTDLQLYFDVSLVQKDHHNQSSSANTKMSVTLSILEILSRLFEVVVAESHPQ